MSLGGTDSLRLCSRMHQNIANALKMIKAVNPSPRPIPRPFFTEGERPDVDTVVALLLGRGVAA